MMFCVLLFGFCLLYANNAASVREKTLGLRHRTPVLPLYYFGSSAYYIERFSRATHDQVLVFCKDLQMEVVDIESKAENDFLFQTIGDLVDFENSDFWTSGVKTEDVWYWTSIGKPFSYTNWSGPRGNGNCLQVIYSSSNMTMFWNATDCSNQRSYVICEAEIGIPTIMSTMIDF